MIGTILGDGCLTPNAYGKNYRLQIEQTAKEKKYVWWKYQVFEKWALSPPKFQKRTNSWKFRTISHPVFTRFYKTFYQKRKKVIPKNVDKLLTSQISLAVWFMDDGALGPKRQGITLNTQNFTKEENERLRKCLAKRFCLKTSLHKDKKYWRIYIFPVSIPRFVKLIRKMVLSEFNYKFPFY